jgi:hypothetical protein
MQHATPTTTERLREPPRPEHPPTRPSAPEKPSAKPVKPAAKQPVAATVGSKPSVTNKPGGRSPVAKQPAPVKSAAKPPETLSQAITRMENEGRTIDKIMGQIHHWHPTWTDSQVREAMSTARKDAASQTTAHSKTGGFFLGLPTDTGMGHTFEPNPQKPKQGHTADKSVKNLHVGDPLGIVITIKATAQDVHAFWNHPSLSSGLAIGLDAAQFVPIDGIAARLGGRVLSKALSKGGKETLVVIERDGKEVTIAVDNVTGKKTVVPARARVSGPSTIALSHKDEELFHRETQRHPD